MAVLILVFMALAALTGLNQALGAANESISVEPYDELGSSVKSASNNDSEQAGSPPGPTSATDNPSQDAIQNNVVLEAHTGSSNQSGDVSFDQTDSTNQNSVTFSDKTESSNQNADVSFDQTDSANQNGVTLSAKTDSSNQNGDVSFDQTDSTNQNSVTLSVKTKDVTQNGVVSSDKTDSTNQNDVAVSDKTEGVTENDVLISDQTKSTDQNVPTGIRYYRHATITQNDAEFLDQTESTTGNDAVLSDEIEGSIPKEVMSENQTYSTKLVSRFDSSETFGQSVTVEGEDTPTTLTDRGTTKISFTELQATSTEGSGVLRENVHYTLNANTCNVNISRFIEASTTFSVEIFTSSNEVQNAHILCRWEIPSATVDQYTNLTFHQLTNYLGGEFTVTIFDTKEGDDFLFVGRSGEEGKPILNPVVIDKAELQNDTIFVVSFHSILFRIETQAANPVIMTVSVTMTAGPYLRHLPVFMLSDTVGYVTSPGFDDGLKYPSMYDGIFFLEVADNESLVTNFLFFDLEWESNCRFDVLNISWTAPSGDDITWTGCNYQKLDVWIFRSSLRMHFQTDDERRFRGFKMMFAVVAKSEEPLMLPSNLLDCSVPHFPSFRPVLSCNLLRECEGWEDEMDCGYSSNDCGLDSIDAGYKCYKFIRPSISLSWNDAYQNCSQQGLKLATFGTFREFTDFKELVATVKDVDRVFVGAQVVARLDTVATEALYRYVWRWVDERTAFSIQLFDVGSPPRCAVFQAFSKPGHFSTLCYAEEEADFLCEFEKDGVGAPFGQPLSTQSSGLLRDPGNVFWNVVVVACPSGHVSRDFLSCDSQSDCGATDDVTSCSTTYVTVPMFVCEASRSALHFSLLCDHVQHCPDNSDEDFCYHVPCPSLLVRCMNGQCVHRDQLCDSVLNCFDGSDEKCTPSRHRYLPFAPPGAVYLYGNGDYTVTGMNDSDPCPNTHFLCPGDFCLPVYLLCNGIADCPGREDEAGCDSFTCPGFYRCRGSRVCVHADHVCDGVPQCPQQDDELLCALTCPDACYCQGLAFVCRASFSPLSFPSLRYLDASSSGMTLADVTDTLYLIGLRLSDCGIRSMPLNVVLPNLRELDVSWNRLKYIHMQSFQSLTNLRVLILTGNPVTQITKPESPGTEAMLLKHIDLSRTNVEVFNGSAFENCPALTTLNLSQSRLHTISEDGLKVTPLLERFDVSGCFLRYFPNDLFRKMSFLKHVHAEDYKLCCKAMLPAGFDPKRCYAPQDLLASCQDLLKSDVYQVFLWTFAALSVVGNMGSIGSRLYMHRRGETVGSFSVFVTNLCLADLLMGVYLTLIGAADIVYRGSYFWHDESWKHSVACSIAGFLSLLSSEVSAFIICFITLDRFLVLRFPFSRIHFTRRSALLACGLVWLVGIALAAVPLLPWTSHWEFYSQTGMCIPLPFTSSERFKGFHYSFSVMIVLNLVLFVLIAAGQAAIYWSVRVNSMSSSKPSSSRDAAVARRLTAVVVSDFLCWFPIGLLGVLAVSGTPIPGEVSVAVAIFVLPFNSALNPFLYTFNIVMEKRQKAHEANLMKRLEMRMRTKSNTGSGCPTSESVAKIGVNKQIEASLGAVLLGLEPAEKAATIQRLKKWLDEQ